jgi:hypothetical protein
VIQFYENTLPDTGWRLVDPVRETSDGVGRADWVRDGRRLQVVASPSRLLRRSSMRTSRTPSSAGPSRRHRGHRFATTDAEVRIIPRVADVTDGIGALLRW